MSAPVSKLAIISGIALPGGIGRSLCHAFLRAGYKVGGLDVVPLELLGENDILLAAQKENNFSFATADVTDEAAVTTALSAIFDNVNCSKVYALINNAAISNPVMSSEPHERIKQWRKYIDVNLTGPFILSEAIIPHMERDSSIIHISSTRAKQSEPDCEGYAASKAGLCGLTHAQATSLRSRHIRVNTVLPGWIDTGGYPISLADHSFHLTGRVGEPSDISSMCLFLSDSSQSGFITGQEFVVDGGVTKKMIYPEEEDEENR